MKRICTRETLNKVIGSICFVLVLVLLLLLLSYCFYPRNSKDATMQEVKPAGLLAEKENTIDALILGDSEAFTAFSPVLMYSEQGFSSYVCATASQYVSLTKSFVNDALTKQTPKVIFLETYSFYRKMRADNAFMTKLQNKFSIIEYHNRWKSFFSLPSEQNSDYSWTDDLKGFKYANLTAPVKPKKYMKASKQIKEIPAANVECIYAINDVCKSKGIRLVFVSSPSQKNWNYEKHNGIQELADRLKVDYIDLNLEPSIQIDWRKDTADRGDHLNLKGAHKVSSFFAKYVSQRYDLPDHRNDKAYSDWNALIKQYKEMVYSKIS